MSRGYWLAAIATGLTISTPAFYASWESYGRYKLEHTKQREEASKYAASASTPYVKRCVDVGSLSICYDEPVQPEPKDKYTEYDLRAQQDMAEWSYVLLLLTLASTAIGVVGLGGLFWSLWQTKTAIKDNREIGEAQTVAYPSIDSFSFELGVRSGDNYRPIINTQWKNAGNTPAFDFGGKFILTVMAPGKSDFTNEYKANIERGLLRIDPGMPESFHATPDDISFTQYVDELMSNSLSIDVEIIGSYRDAFRNTVPFHEYFRSSAIYSRPNTGEPGGEYIFNIKMAKQHPAK